MRQAYDLLRKFYGYRSFRPGQLEIISAATEGRDSLVLMPTGGGKSLCYQLPALMLDGCAIVVSPLIALMEDQTAALVANGIPAAAIHSGRYESDNRTAIEAACAGRIKLLYISPERLMADIDLWPKKCPVSLIAIDEAHCISQWGHDFRPVYTQLSALRTQFPGVPMMALTATADRLTRDDIAAQLGLRDPMRWIGSFDRPNLSLEVRRNASKKDKVACVSSLIRRHPNDSGIVYTLSRAGAEDAHEALSRLGYRSCVYHAGMSADERYRAQAAFSNGDVQVVCATIAFGMGIDKSNIRWVVHFNMPANVESYYQEIGRAGRDGLPATTIMFYSMQDVIMRRRFNEDSGRPELAAEKLQWMLRYAESTVCRRRMLLSYFGQAAEHDCGNCDVCRNPPERFDGTVLFQMAASAVIRTDSQIGVFLLNDILRGSARAEIRNRGFDRIKTFGVGRQLDNRQWADYIAQMVQLGLFEIAFDDSNHLRVTPYGMKALHGGVKVELSRYVPLRDEPKSRGNAKKKPEVPADPVEQLLEQLKAVRKALAAKLGVPAFVVFSDASLLDMARRRPSSIDSFLEVHGVGEKKAVQYGKHFISAIRKFEGLNGGQEKGTSLKETLILHNAGLSLAEIADTKHVKTETILEHIAQLIDNDLVTTFAPYITKPIYDNIISAWEADPDNAVRSSADKYSPSLIHVALAIRKYHMRHG